MSRAALLLPVLLLAACVTVGPTPVSSLPWHQQGDRLLQAGDFEGAARAYERHLADEPGSPVVEEKLKTAHGRSAHAWAIQALELAAAGEAEAADALLTRAETRAPWAAAVRRARNELGDRVDQSRRSAQLRSEAEALMRSDPEAAMDRLAEARQMNPGDADLVRLLREATLRTDAQLSARRAAAAWDRGDRDVALRELSHASFAGTRVTVAEVLLARIGRDLEAEATSGDLNTRRAARQTGVEAGLPTARRQALRELLGEALAARAGDLLATGRPATAALLEIERRRLGIDGATPALDAVRDRAQLEVAVLPFEDATGGDVDGLRLARAIVNRIVEDAGGGGLAIRAFLATDPAVVAARPRALRLSGRVTRVRVGEGPRSRSRKMVRVQTGVREEVNPAAAEAAADLDRVEAREAIGARELEDARDELSELESLPHVKGPRGKRIGTARSELEIAIARAQIRVNRAQRRHDDLAGEALRARTRVSTTPTRAEIPIWGERARSIVEFRKAATLTASIQLTDGSDTLLDAPVSGSASHDEVIADALPDAGLPADPDETPDDAEMARRAAEHFAGLAAGQVRTAAIAAARHLLQDARAAERAGRTDDAAEGYAMYLLVTPEVASPQRADAARALRELAGVSVAVRTGDARRNR